MIQIVFVLLFTAAGAAVALLAIRAAPLPIVRWLAGGFAVVATANLGLHLWPAVAANPAGTVRGAAIALGLGLAVWGYARLLGAARRAAAERRDGE